MILLCTGKLAGDFLLCRIVKDSAGRVATAGSYFETKVRFLQSVQPKFVMRGAIDLLEASAPGPKV